LACNFGISATCCTLSTATIVLWTAIPPVGPSPTPGAAWCTRHRQWPGPSKRGAPSLISNALWGWPPRDDAQSDGLLVNPRPLPVLCPCVHYRDGEAPKNSPPFFCSSGRRCCGGGSNHDATSRLWSAASPQGEPLSNALIRQCVTSPSRSFRTVSVLSFGRGHGCSSRQCHPAPSLVMELLSGRATREAIRRAGR